MADNTIIQQSRFTATGNPVTLNVNSGVDWISVLNLTALNTSGGGTDLPFKFFFQLGMQSSTASPYGIKYTKLDTVANDPITVSALSAGVGFKVYNSGDISTQLGLPVAATGYTDVVRPIVATGSTTGLVSGSVVRLYGFVSGNPLNGLDVSIDTIVANTSFRVSGALATAPGAAGTNVVGQTFYRVVNFDPMFYPPFRYVVNVTQAANAVVTVSVPSLYQVGQKVEFFIPAQYGMTELNGLTGTVTAVTNTIATQSITVNIDTSAFTAFRHITYTAPDTATLPFSRAMVVPSGMDTGYALSLVPIVNPLSGAITNIATRGIQLLGGASAGAAAGPAGAAGDEMMWMAGKSFSVNVL